MLPIVLPPMDPGTQTPDPVAPRAPMRAGLRCVSPGLEVALLDETGRLVEVIRIAEEFRAVMRTVKRWQRTWGLDRTTLVFCIGMARPWPGALLAGLISNQWDVLVVPAASDDPERGSEGASDIALSAIAAPRSVTLLTPAMLESGKLEDLRARRERIAMLRSGLQAESMRNEGLEAELKREFERMDRRLLEVLNKLIARLDTLIGLRSRGV